MTIEITVNGNGREVASPATIASLLEQFGLQERMVVVEHNGEIVRRDVFNATAVRSGDTIEIVQMMAGG